MTAGLTNTVALAKAADESRGLAIDSISKAASGHMGLPLGCAEIGAVLFGQELQCAPPGVKIILRFRSRFECVRSFQLRTIAGSCGQKAFLCSAAFLSSV